MTKNTIIPTYEQNKYNVNKVVVVVVVYMIVCVWCIPKGASFLERA